MEGLAMMDLLGGGIDAGLAEFLGNAPRRLQARRAREDPDGLCASARRGNLARVRELLSVQKLNT